jgi:hypothetical protein
MRKGGPVKVNRVCERTSAPFAGAALQFAGVFAAGISLVIASGASADPQNILPPDVSVPNQGQTSNAGFQPGMAPGVVPGSFPGQQQGMPPNFGQQQMMMPNQQMQMQQRAATDSETIKQWFNNYDSVRRAAQMNPKERARADYFLSKPLAMVMPGDEKVETKKLLTSLVNRYNVAAEQMTKLPPLPETEQLRRGYFQYFSTARNLFFDYVKVQDNLFATDPSGNALAGTLMARKQQLEMLDNNNKMFDAQLRTRLGVPPFKY